MSSLQQPNMNSNNSPLYEFCFITYNSAVKFDMSKKCRRKFQKIRFA